MITTLRNHKHTHIHALYTCPQVLVESCTTFVFVTLDPMNRRCCWHTCERAGRGKKAPQEQERERERERDDVQHFQNFNFFSEFQQLRNK
jgi:hypothetical protein